MIMYTTIYCILSSIQTFVIYLFQQVGDWSPNRPDGKRFDTTMSSTGPAIYVPMQSNRTWRIATKVVK
jgi:hypothetical protein